MYGSCIWISRSLSSELTYCARRSMGLAENRQSEKNNVRDKDSKKSWKLQRNLDCFETLHPVGSREPETFGKLSSKLNTTYLCHPGCEFLNVTLPAPSETKKKDR